MIDLFLIAHRVRGEPAFDVASRVECAVCKGDYDIDRSEESLCTECDDTGFWWIVPTSGHRAYPYWHTELKGLGYDISYPGEPEFDPIFANLPPMPPALPDHYTSRAATVVPSGLAALLAKRKPLNVERRGR